MSISIEEIIILVCVCTHMCVWYMQVCAYMYIQSVCAYVVYVCVPMCVCVCLCSMCIFVHMYLFTYVYAGVISKLWLQSSIAFHNLFWKQGLFDTGAHLLN